MNTANTLTSAFTSTAAKAAHAEESVLEFIDPNDFDMSGMEQKLTEVMYSELMIYSRTRNTGTLKIITPRGYSILGFYDVEGCDHSIPHLFHSTGGCYIPSPELSLRKALWLTTRALMLDYRA